MQSWREESLQYAFYDTFLYFISQEHLCPYYFRTHYAYSFLIPILMYLYNLLVHIYFHEIGTLCDFHEVYCCIHVTLLASGSSNRILSSCSHQTSTPLNICGNLCKGKKQNILYIITRQGSLWDTVKEG